MSGVAYRSPAPADLAAVPKLDADSIQATRLRRAAQPDTRPSVQRLSRAAPHIQRMTGTVELPGGTSNSLSGRTSLAGLRRVLCAASACLALAGLAGWFLHAEMLKTLLPGLPPMKVNTALAVLALSVAQWPEQDGGARQPGWSRLRLGCEVVALVLAAATLGECAAGLYRAPGRPIGADLWATYASDAARPSPATMAAIASAAAASIVLGRPPSWCAAAAHWLVAPAAATGTLSLIGFAYGVERVPGPGLAMALGSALALCALSAAIALNRPAESWGSVLAGRPAARAVFARLLPASFVLPSVTGLLVLAGVRSGHYSPIFGFAIFAILTVVAFIALSWETALVAARVEGALQRSNAGLLAARLRAEEATRAKSRFVAGMSHELRTPLHAILGYAELLSTEGTLRASQLARVMQMLATGRHLLDTINSVLAMSEIETGRLELRPRATDLRQLAAECIDLVRPAAGAKGLDIAVEAASDLPETIVTDATRLRQIVVNLLGNAVKFTERGSVTLGLRLDAAAKAFVCIDVADTGRGIAPDRRAALFQEFERLGVEREGHIEGAGLGLAIALRLAVMMGGHIGHTDNRGGGSIFTLSLPLAQEATVFQAAPLVPNLARIVGDTAADPVPRRILIVDDVEMNREIATAFLRSAGHLVTQAGSGGEALREAAGQAFDVVLMDVRLGDINGFEATRRIRALGGESARVPIIAMTAHVFTDQIEACGRAGMDFHLPKPFDRATLLAAVETAIEWRDSLCDPQERHPDRALRTGTGPVIDMARLESIAAYLPAGGLARHLESLANTTETLMKSLRALDMGTAGIPACLVDQLHSLAGKAGMMGFMRLASSASRVDHLAHGGERVSDDQIECLLHDMNDAVAETRCRLEVATR